MENFFKDRLQNDTPATDGWNVPSDQIWENALPHLPKKKNRRFLFGYVLAFLFVGAVGYFALSQFDFTPNELEEAVVSETSGELDDSSLQNSLVNSESETTSLENSRVNSETEQTSNVATIEKSNQTEKALKQNATPTQRTTSNTKGGIRNEKIVSNINRAFVESLPINSSEESVEVDVGPKPAKIANSIEGSAQSTLPNKSIESSGGKNFNAVSPISLMNLKKVNKTFEPIVLAERKTLPINPIKTGLPKREVGIYHLYKPVSFLTGEINLNEESEVLKVGFSYGHLGLSYTQWVKKRWSFSTGIAYSELATAFNVDVEGKLTSSDINSFINQQFGEIANQGSPVSKGSNELVINIKPGFMVNPGDEVILSGDFNIDLKLYEIPFFINHHWFRNRFEYSAGIGGSVDFVMASQRARNLTLIRGADVISEPTPDQEEHESQMFGTGYIQGGVKYKLSEQLNLGTTVRVGIIQPVFSGVEVGIYYRWNS